MTIRAFIAMAIPLDVSNHLGDIAAKMAYQDKSNAVRWVDQSNYHITLAFLGEQSMHTLEQLADELDEAIKQPSFTVSIKHLSPFPQGKPKLIAALLEPNQALLNVHKQVSSALYAAQITPQKRRFAPHITLGRYRHRATGTASVNTLALNKINRIALNTVILYASTLTPNGAYYDELYHLPLDDDALDSQELA